MKTITAKHVTYAIPPGCDNTALAQRIYLDALAQLEAATVGGLEPAELKFSIILRGSDALAEILEAAAETAQKGNDISGGASGIAALFLQRRLDAGDEIEIPSLGVTIKPAGSEGE